MENLQRNFDLVKRKYNLGIDQLKAEQENTIMHLLGNENVVCILPTGFGKSMAYILPPLLLDEMHPETSPHLAIVVSPLTALMLDQVDICTRMGIPAIALTRMKLMTPESTERFAKGDMSIIFTSPEALYQGGWLLKLKRKETRRRVCLIAFDEVHCLSEWGADFRPDYLHTVELRSVFTNVPCLCSSATITEKVMTDVQKALRLQDNQFHLVAVLPDRPNIFLEVQHQASYDEEEDLLWLVDDIEKLQGKLPKTIIFAQTIRQVVEIYEVIKTTLGMKAYLHGVSQPTNRLVSMYHGQVATDLQQYTLENFRKPDSPLRVLVSTIAFGMGIEVLDIQLVIHWGKSQSMLSHWQEVGRCGRDGRPAKAIWYPKSTAGEDKEVFECIKKDHTTCVRKTILQHFVLPGMDLAYLKSLDDRSPEQLQSCCSHCKN